MKTILRYIILLIGMLLMSFVSMGQTWQETTTIVSGQEYLIGFVSGNNIYLAVSYAPNESSHYYTSDNNTNWRGYTALANFSGNNIVGVSGYADDLQYCTWIFNGDSQNGYTIQSAYNENYYLRTWSNLSYDDLYPDNTTSNGTSWKYQNGALYRTIDNTDRYAQYYYLNNTNIGPHMSVTSTQLTNNVRLYTNPNVCHKPTNLQVSNITTNSAHITWESENNNFEYSFDGLDWTLTSQHYIDKTGLDSNTEYTFYIKSICNENDESNIFSITFTTKLCNDICIIQYELADSWGDGWNGSYIEVSDYESDIIYDNLTINSGNHNSGTLEICNWSDVKFTWYSGNWVSECSYTIKDVNDNEIFSGSGAFSDEKIYTAHNCDYWPLPISLLSFTASPQTEYNLVQWATATEKNNDIFILERSEDAVVFDEVYNVSGAGNSLEPIDYEIRDYCPVPDITYYRLTQVDYDGSKTTSEMVSCIRTSEKMSNWEYFTRYDNLLQVHSNDKVLDIVCSDLLGRTIWQGKIPPHDDTELDLKKPYMVHIYEDDVLVGSEKVFR